MDIRADGTIRGSGRGLVLAGSNLIGRNPVPSVRVRLVCGGLAHQSNIVPLSPSGDFRIDDVLTPVPPNPCNSPVLLITNVAGTAWAAAGVLRD